MDTIEALAKPITEEVDRVLNPSKFYGHPRDVLQDAALTREEKKALLASWASDACAVEMNPTLRLPPTLMRVISFDEVMDAMRDLDEADKPVPDWKRKWPKFGRPRAMEITKPAV